MAPRPALDRWLAAADDLLDETPLIGRRLGLLAQEAGRALELRYGAVPVLGDEYLQLVNVDPATGRGDEQVLVRRDALCDLATHLAQLIAFVSGGPR